MATRNSTAATVESLRNLPRRRQSDPGFALSEGYYRGGLYFLGFLLVSFLVIEKASVVHGYRDPLVLVYTVLVTSFELSRVFAAMFYKSTDHAKASDEASDMITGEFEPTVSFVIPCMNEEASIAHTIEQSFQVDYPAAKVEVIVINDGSTDGTARELNRMARIYPRLKVVHWKKNRGKRHGMAEGFARAKGEIIVQLDSDSYIDGSTFRAFIEPFRNRTIGAVCAHADPTNADQNLLTRMQAAYYFMSFRILKAAESAFFTVFCCSGCSSAYRKDVVMPIMDEWLKERFLGKEVTWGDDRALTNWVLRLGYKTIYTDEARAYTICPDNFRQLLKQQVRWKKGWMVNSWNASRFIWRAQPFVAFTYFFPLVFLTMITPFMALKALVYNPIVYGTSPFTYMAGILLVAVIITVYYRAVARENKYWPFVLVWSALNMTVLSFVLFFAVADMQNRKWGTR